MAAVAAEHARRRGRRSRPAPGGRRRGARGMRARLVPARKQRSWLSRLSATGRPASRGERAHLRLRELAEREAQAREGRGASAREHVGLVLAPGRRRRAAAAPRASSRDARVVAGGEARGAEAFARTRRSCRSAVAVAAHARFGVRPAACSARKSRRPPARKGSRSRASVRDAHPVRERAGAEHRCGEQQLRSPSVAGSAESSLTLRVSPVVRQQRRDALSTPPSSRRGAAAAPAWASKARRHAAAARRVRGAARRRPGRRRGACRRRARRARRRSSPASSARRRAAARLDELDDGAAGGLRRAPQPGALEARPATTPALDAHDDAHESRRPRHGGDHGVKMPQPAAAAGELNLPMQVGVHRTREPSRPQLAEFGLPTRLCWLQTLSGWRTSSGLLEVTTARPFGRSWLNMKGRPADKPAERSPSRASEPPPTRPAAALRPGCPARAAARSSTGAGAPVIGSAARWPSSGRRSRRGSTRGRRAAPRSGRARRRCRRAAGAP